MPRTSGPWPTPVGGAPTRPSSPIRREAGAGAGGTTSSLLVAGACVPPPPPRGGPAAAAGTIKVGDLSVHRLGFGAMRITGAGIWGEPPDRDQAKAVLRRAVDLDVTFIDTADSYGPEVSENLIAEALHPYAEDLVIATKGGLTRPGPNRWTPDGRPEHLRSACERGLPRLRPQHPPLSPPHRPAPHPPP